MKIDFRNFDDSYYEQVCDFLIEISSDNRRHIKDLYLLMTIR